MYRVARDGNIQTGIWTVTSVDDYQNNKIKKHELTKPEREAFLIDYLQQTGIDANPVLITYNAVPAIDNVIHTICLTGADLSFTKAGALHQLWKIDDSQDVSTIIEEFAKLSSAYIADGHHRAAAASLLALKQRRLKPGYTGREEFNFFTTVYMASDQLKIYPFHRLGKDLNSKTIPEFIGQLAGYFDVESADGTYIPGKLHEFGMYAGGQWYKLTARPDTYDPGSSVSELDVTILQDTVFKRILEVCDPRVDPRISFIGGITPPDNLTAQVDQGDYAVAFTLFPTSIEQLMKVADQGGVMPPKSTWFEPKFQAGLLIHKIN